MRRTVLDDFEKTVCDNIDKIALIHNDTEINFGELQSRSKELGKFIVHRTKGVTNKPIVVLLPKSIEAVIADIGILYSCNIFNNLDVKTPVPRLKNILDLLKPAAIITNTKYSDLIDYDNEKINVINIDTFCKEEDIDDQLLYSRLYNVIDTDPFCIINTSGSTGTPKGVVLNYRSFFDFLSWATEKFSFDGSEIIGALSPIVFDIYDFELCLMMTKGSTIVLLDSSLAVFPAKLLNELKHHNVNFIFWVPTIMVNIANMDLLTKISVDSLKTVWFAGEVFPTKQFNYWKKNLPKAVFVNLYGPIEITLDCIYYIVDRDFADDEPLPIGFACENTDILLLNDNNMQCEIGEDGEICVRGTSLAMGYYNNPEKTASVFVQNPLNSSYPELIYRTGDIAVINERGEYIFKGRKDSLIKHQGYRIELGEIEHETVNNLKLAKNCCVVYKRKSKEIVMFYEKSSYEGIEIKKSLGKILPRYMVPTVYEELNELPRNTNGKIDRLKLTNLVNEED